MKKVLTSIAFLLLIAGCSNDIRSTLGMRKESPDEFTVVSYPPLSVPPEFSLHQSHTDNRDIMHGGGKDHAPYSREENLILKAISNPQQKSSVDKDIDKEDDQRREEKENKGVIRSTLSKLNADDEQEWVIDPESEKQRISQNLAEGHPINEGEVKSIKPTKSLIERIFG